MNAAARTFFGYRRGWRRAIGALTIPVVLLMVGMIRGYQLLVSPLLGPRCKFYPSCSAYGIEALSIHGPSKGLLLITGRVCRCHPWQLGGINPPPPYRQWRAEVDLDGVLRQQRRCFEKHDLVGV